MLADRHRFARRLDGLRRRPATAAVLDRIADEIEVAVVRRQVRAAGAPAVTYPQELPVSQRKDDIAAAIRDHQVVIVAGETGSGKTTQLPKICLELGRGVDGLIGHTQPRRIAARTVADRIAEELGTELGAAVGYQVRFADQVGSETLVKVMTDGILLAEVRSDRMLERYDTIIIDEAHERSLNIDFLLGCLAQILPRRPDLKLIITSATIDPERFSRHFGGAPIVEVSGRTYPVEVRYRPLIPDDSDGTEEPDEPRDQPQAVCDAVEELAAEGPGDILVFCSGEREIRDTAEALAALKLSFTEILPLYARLSIAEQHKVFAPHTGRRIVLATNVAETSLTVPGIRYVVDPGTARISRYSHRLKVQRLPIEPVSQASANQRKGRCGRTSDGICIRLYSEDDFNSRPEFTEPEILRTNLAGVILQMTAYGLGDMAEFPFIDPPDRRNITDGVALLHELGAFTDKRALTPLGRKLAGLPVDPRMARMVLEADRNGCLREVMVIAAALSIIDPRERPTDRQQAATEKHARFTQPDSDFLSLLHLWAYLQKQQRELSGNQFRKLCRSDFLNYLRVREWQDIYGQLRQAVKTLGLTVPPQPKESHDADQTTPVYDADAIHRSLLAGMLSHIGLKDTDVKRGDPAVKPDRRARFEYIGARGARFSIAPGSALFKTQPSWVFAAELVETSRLWARMVAKIDPEWAETLAGHLVKRSYNEPHWERKQAAVIAYEKVLLYGIPLVAARKINYGRIDPALSRELFIRHALVEGDWDTHHAFFAENRELLDEVEELEHRARRRDILVSDEDLYAFYDARIPADVVSGRHFDAWWRRARREQPDLLSFEKAMLVNEGVRTVDKADYPDVFPVDGAALPLTYQFEPGTHADGVTVSVPLPVLAGLRQDPFDWQIPGLRADLIAALIKSLPKAHRRSLVPAPDTAAAFLERVSPDGRTAPDEPLLATLEREFRRMTGVLIARADWDLSRVPDHLRITFRVLDDQGKALAEGKDLEALKAQLKVQAQAVVSAAADGIEEHGLTAWLRRGPLPRSIERRHGGYQITAYPALVDERDSVGVRAFDSPQSAAQAMVAGTRRLLLLTIPSPVPAVSRRLSNDTKLVLMRSPGGNVGQLMADCVDAAVDALVAEFGGPAWDEAAFDTLRDHVRAELHDEVFEVVGKVRTVLAGWHAVTARVEELSPNAALKASLDDVRTQLSGLVYAGFVTAAGAGRLTDLARYLRAVERRLERLPADPARDRAQMATVRQVMDEYAQWLTELPADAPGWDEVRAVRWMVEELRVNLFAQALGTPYPISDRRIYRAMDDISG